MTPDPNPLVPVSNPIAEKDTASPSAVTPAGIVAALHDHIADIAADDSFVPTAAHGAPQVAEMKETILQRFTDFANRIEEDLRNML